MKTGRRTTVVALAVLAGPALAGCTGYAGDGYADSANQVPRAPVLAATGTPTPAAAVAANNAAPPVTAVVGIQTDRLTAATIRRWAPR